jgi:ankyrin repeat protein
MRTSKSTTSTERNLQALEFDDPPPIVHKQIPVVSVKQVKQPEPRVVQESDIRSLVAALMSCDLEQVIKLRDQLGSSWLAPIACHNGDNAFHLIYKYVSGKVETWPYLKDFSDTIEKDGDFVKSLLTKNNLGLTAVHYACIYGSFEDAEFLITSLSEGDWKDYRNLLEKANVKLQDKKLRNNLDSKVFEAVTDPTYTAVLDFLLGMGASINHRNGQGETPILAALRSGNEDAVRMLAERHADLNLEDNEGNNCLRLAIQMELKPEWISFLIDNGADANDTYAVIDAINSGNVENLETLLDNGAKVSELVRAGSLFLSVLANPDHNNHGKIIQAIIDQYQEESGFNKKRNKLIRAINMQGADGKSALFVAAEKGYHEAVSVLLKNGADPSLLDSNKRAPSDIASNLELKLVLEKSRVNALEKNMNHLEQLVKNQSSRLSALERKVLQ